VVLDTERRCPGECECIADFCMLKVRKCGEYRAPRLEGRSAELVGGFEFIVERGLALGLKEPEAGGVKIRQLALGALVLIDTGGPRYLLVLRYVIAIELGMEPRDALVQVRYAAEQRIGQESVRRRLMILYRAHDKCAHLPIFACAQRPMSAYERIGNVAVIAPCDKTALSEGLGKLTDLQLAWQARSEKIVRPHAAIELQQISPVFHPAADCDAVVVQGAGVQKLYEKFERLHMDADLEIRTF